MGKSTQSGICHICGSDGPLSFEHVPPKSAFNDKPIVWRMGKDALDNLPSARGPIKRRGAGNYTLCPPCNNQTGSWYGSAYAKWAYQGMSLVECAKADPGLDHIFYIFRVFPLRVIKQIFCMFFSINQPSFSKASENLVRVVLNKEQKYKDRSLRVFAYLTPAPMARQSGISGQLNLADGGMYMSSESAFPPFGYILAVDGKSPDNRLEEISFFSEYSYDQLAEVELRLPVFNLFTAFPGDFRSRDEVLTPRGAYRKT